MITVFGRTAGRPESLCMLSVNTYRFLMPSWVAVLLHLSHHHCVAICATLVPLNLLATSSTLYFCLAGFPRRYQIRSLSLAVGLALILLLHVGSWWIVGVVRVQTYILVALSCICLGLNALSWQGPGWLRRVGRPMFSP